jgi:hypothetical protein
MIIIYSSADCRVTLADYGARSEKPFINVLCSMLYVCNDGLWNIF